MTSVPLPLKFLAPHFGPLEEAYARLPADAAWKKDFADLLSVISTVLTVDEPKVLQYRLEGNEDGLLAYGMEYLKTLSRQLIKAYEKTDDEKIIQMVDKIAPFYVKNHNEFDAVDLLIEVQRLQELNALVDKENYASIFKYAMAITDVAHDDEPPALVECLYQMALTQQAYGDALLVAMRKNNDDLKIIQVLNSCQIPVHRKQLYLMLADAQWRCPETAQLPDALESEIGLVLTNSHRYKVFQYLAKELDVIAPKKPSDIFGAEPGTTRLLAESALLNLSSTIASSLVNASHGTDCLMTGTDRDSWLFKNREPGVITAAASLGLVHRWNIEEGIEALEVLRGTASSDAACRAGALAGLGIVCSGVNDTCDAACALLTDALESSSTLTGQQRDGAVFGLGLSQAASKRSQLLSLLVPLIVDTSLTVSTSAIASWAIGMIFVGSADTNAAEAIVQTLMERSETNGSSLNDPIAFLFAVGLGLLFQGCKNTCQATLDALKVIDHPFLKYVTYTIQGFAYAGTNDLTVIQSLLKVITDTTEGVVVGDDNNNNTTNTNATTTAAVDGAPANNNSGTTDDNQANEMAIAAAVIAIPAVSIGEELSTQMQQRLLGHLYQYAGGTARRVVPLAIALSMASRPTPTVVEQLARMAHDSDPNTALNGLLSLGIVGAGTNHAKIAEILRGHRVHPSNLSALFCRRVALGMLYAGKGLLTLSPIMMNGRVVCPVALASLMSFIHVLVHAKSTILSKAPLLFYTITPALRPKVFVTVDENLNPVGVNVRVGQAVDTAGQAGQPREVAGFQAHTSPVLLSVGERAEIAGDDYVPIIPCPLEGVVIVKPGAQ